MDKKSSPNAGPAVHNRTWKDSISDLIELRQRFSNLEVASIALPYGFDTFEPSRNIQKFKPFGGFDLLIEDFLKLASPFNPSIHPMVFSVGQYPKTRRPYRRLTQIFPAQITDSFFKKSSGYYYTINKTGCKTKEICISKTLITGSIVEIEKQARKLIQECNRFFFLYCESIEPVTNQRHKMPF